MLSVEKLGSFTVHLDGFYRGDNGAASAQQKVSPQRPPSDFVMPEDAPKLPDYNTLEAEGLPPDYDNLSIAPPAFSSPAPSDRQGN